jgi:hypothetical protein
VYGENAINTFMGFIGLILCVRFENLYYFGTVSALFKVNFMSLKAHSWQLCPRMRKVH